MNEFTAPMTGRGVGRVDGTWPDHTEGNTSE